MIGVIGRCMGRLISGNTVLGGIISRAAITFDTLT